MSQEIPTEVRTEGEPAFPVQAKENDNSSDSSPVDQKQTTVEQTQSQGGEQNPGANQDANAQKTEGESKDAGFADHPAWKAREDSWKNRFNVQEQRHADDMAQLTNLVKNLEAKLGQSSQKSDVAHDEMPPWFGGNEDQWKQFSGHIGSLIEKAVERAKEVTLGEITSKSTQEQRLADEATRYMNEQISEIETSPELNPGNEQVDKQKLFKIAHDFHLVDPEGRWNWKVAWQFYKNMKGQAKPNPVVQEKKKIAEATVSDKKSESKPPAYKTPDDFKSKSWADL